MLKLERIQPIKLRLHSFCPVFLDLANNTPKLYLNNKEFIWARNALNALRDEYITAERYIDGVYAVIMKLMKSKYRNCKEIAA